MFYMTCQRIQKDDTTDIQATGYKQSWEVCDPAEQQATAQKQTQSEVQEISLESSRRKGTQ